MSPEVTGLHLRDCERIFMEMKVNYLGDVQFEAEARGHKIICDQPLDNGGADEGMTPPEFLLASLATCAGFYAVQYLKVRQLPADGLVIRISAGKATQPARMDQFEIIIDAPPMTSDKDLEGMRRSAEKCLVKNTLMMPPSISLQVKAQQPA
jgi:uncharacterized OsmC-like protein